MTGQDEPVAYRPFRERLDAVLRTKDPDQVRAFLIEQGQWSEADQGDSAFAMWMMIAGSPALGSLHGEAERWLRDHGHADEAQIIAGGRKGSGKPGRSGPSHPHHPSQRGSGQPARGGRPQRDRPRRKG